MDDPVEEVDGGSPLPGLFIDGAAPRDVVGHVGDVYTEALTTIGKGLEGDGVVVVPRLLGVHRQDRQIPKVQAPLQLPLAIHSGIGQQGSRLGLGQGIRRGRDPVGGRGGLEIVAGIIGAADHAEESAPAGPPRSGLHLHHDEITLPRRIGHGFVEMDQRIGGGDRAEAATTAVGPHPRARGGRTGAGDAPTGPLPALARLGDFHLHPLPVGRTGQSLGRNKEIGLAAAGHEAEAPRMDGEASPGSPGGGGQDIALPPDAPDLASLLQIPHGLPEESILVAAHTEAAG